MGEVQSLLMSELSSHVRHRALYAAQAQHSLKLRAHVVLSFIGTLFDHAERLVIHVITVTLPHRVGNEVDARMPGLFVFLKNDRQQRAVLGDDLFIAATTG